jgi:2-oxoisovalerate dehydrogenase E2 component (dihydrolipoyl transacylase)
MGRYVFKLPDVGEGTAEAEIVAWHVAVGQTIEEDAPLVDVMTDKATVEMTSPVAGTVIEINGAPGDMAPVGSGIVVLEVEGAGNAAGGASAPAAQTPERPAEDREAIGVPSPSMGEGSGLGVNALPVPEKEPEAASLPKSEPAAQHPLSRPLPHQGGEAKWPNRSEGEKPLASPAVRRRAEDLGIKLSYVPGSGPAGRIEHADLDAFIASKGQNQTMAARSQTGGSSYAQRTAVEDIKVIGLRRKIAEKMQDAKRRIPHFAYIEEVDMTELEALRAHLNATHKDRGKLTVPPFFMRALVKVLPDYPQINARFDDDAGVVHRHAAVHIGIATQTANGLIVPVVKHAETLDLWAAAAEVARVSAAARENKAKSEELSGSTITITSLGPLGGIATTPVINHPEVAIIGPNKIVERPVVRGGQVVVRKMMNLSSSFDHRVVDGYDAAEFIQRVKGLLEHPATLFID